jgi:KipI family sensor histidine kinase inhibitor
VNLRPYGETAVLLEVSRTEPVLGWYAALTERPPPGVTELVPAARTILLRFDPALTDAATLTDALADMTPRPVDTAGGEPVTIPVRYDGADLAEVADATGLTETEVIDAHTTADYVVAFSGFAPGFGYLTGLDPRLRLPRRSTPRTRVPAGAVGIAGEFTGVYPRPSPGGWLLLGHTTTTLWDPESDTPALLRPGTAVRFAAVDDLPEPDPPARQPRPGTAGGILVVHSGPLTTVQDRGRPGYAALGVSASGAADPASAALANRLVGNQPDAACLETTLGGLTLEFREPARVAVTGAPGALRLSHRAAAVNAPFSVPAGDRLTIGTPDLGLRSYVAVRGGIDVPATLDSRATDVLSGLGPAPLRDGDVLPIGTATAGPPPAVDLAPVAALPDTEITVRVLPGPRADWFTDDAHTTLHTAAFTVTADVNRIGVRLDGPELTRARTDELPSEATVAGAVQVPPSGQPVVFLADHPVTGGYPVIAVVRAADLPLLAQARPGQRVRFRQASTCWV